MDIQDASIKWSMPIPKFLNVCGTLQFLLFEHFVEHGKLTCLIRVPEVRGCGRDCSELSVLFSVDSSIYIPFT